MYIVTAAKFLQQLSKVPENMTRLYVHVHAYMYEEECRQMEGWERGV